MVEVSGKDSFYGEFFWRGKTIFAEGVVWCMGLKEKHVFSAAVASAAVAHFGAEEDVDEAGEPVWGSVGVAVVVFAGAVVERWSSVFVWEWGVETAGGKWWAAGEGGFIGKGCIVGKGCVIGKWGFVGKGRSNLLVDFVG